MSGGRLLAIVALLAGCAGVPPPPPVNLELPAAGTRWVWHSVDSHGTSIAATWTVLEDGVWEGRPVHRVTDTRDVRLHDTTTGNWVATLRDGQARLVASPHEGIFSWPLRVGKSWVARVTLEDRERGFTWSPVVTFWHVERWEQVVVKAGTFWAFKLEGTPGINNVTYTTLWYAPEIRLVIKQVRERTDETGRPLRVVSELVEYHPTP